VIAPRTHSVATCLAVLATVLVSQHALAQGIPEPVAVAIIAPPLVADLVFTAYDLDRATRAERASQGMAVAESLVAFPQVLLGGWVIVNILSNQPVTPSARDDLWLAVGYTAWMGGLTAHGVATLFVWRDDPLPEASPALTHTGRQTFALAPTFGDPSSPRPGVSAFGRF
jgi:hypothetical protein